MAGVVSTCHGPPNAPPGRERLLFVAQSCQEGGGGAKTGNGDGGGDGRQDTGDCGSIGELPPVTTGSLEPGVMIPVGIRG